VERENIWLGSYRASLSFGSRTKISIGWGKNFRLVFNLRCCTDDRKLGLGTDKVSPDGTTAAGSAKKNKMNSLQMFVATIPAEITTAVTDLEGVWDLLQPVILSVGIFVVLWRFFRKGARKVG